tara:strand:+ start:87 stop:449 length:363 start_codon:yes stop_codon:yes gene_type:complete
MDNFETKYTSNNKKFREIKEKFAHIATSSFYATHLKIAVAEYVNYLNHFSDEGLKTVSINSRNPKSDKFAIKKGGRFVSNQKLISKAILMARNKRQFLTMSFFDLNIVLDKLNSNLERRN